MSFSVLTPNAGQPFSQPPSSDRARTEATSARVWEDPHFTNTYEFGSPPLRKGSIRGFGTSLCPHASVYGGRTVHHLFLVDSPDATHHFDASTGTDSIMNIPPGATFVFVLFTTTDQYGCDHSATRSELNNNEIAALGAFSAGLSFSVFDASVGLATCAYSDSCPGGPVEMCTDPCACSTGLVPRSLFGNLASAGQVVQSRSVGACQP
eukprot:SAG11_NODE_461_length_9234_cov_10.929611_4_plen_208_part_00